MKRLLIGALALTTLGLAACGEAGTHAAPPAAATTADYSTTIAGLTVHWNGYDAQTRKGVCDEYNASTPAKVDQTADQDHIDRQAFADFLRERC